MTRGSTSSFNTGNNSKLVGTKEGNMSVSPCVCVCVFAFSSFLCMCTSLIVALLAPLPWRFIAALAGDRSRVTRDSLPGEPEGRGRRVCCGDTAAAGSGRRLQPVGRVQFGRYAGEESLASAVGKSFKGGGGWALKHLFSFWNVSLEVMLLGFREVRGQQVRLSIGGSAVQPPP